MATINHLQGYAFAKKKGDTIHVFEGPHTLADFMPVIADGTDVPRMLKDRFADVVNVKDFGAVGDGTTDDTAAFEAALALCEENGKGLFVPFGSYLITDSLSSPMILWTGDGAELVFSGLSGKNGISFTGDSEVGAVAGMTGFVLTSSGSTGEVGIDTPKNSSLYTGSKVRYLFSNLYCKGAQRNTDGYSFCWQTGFKTWLHIGDCVGAEIFNLCIQGTFDIKTNPQNQIKDCGILLDANAAILTARIHDIAIGPIYDAIKIGSCAFYSISDFDLIGIYNGIVQDDEATKIFGEPKIFEGNINSQKLGIYLKGSASRSISSVTVRRHRSGWKGATNDWAGLKADNCSDLSITRCTIQPDESEGSFSGTSRAIYAIECGGIKMTANLIGAGNDKGVSLSNCNNYTISETISWQNNSTDVLFDLTSNTRNGTIGPYSLVSSFSGTVIDKDNTVVNPNTLLNSNIDLQSNSNVNLDLTRTNANENEKKWRIVVGVNQMNRQTVSDAGSGTNFEIIERDGTNVASIEWRANGFKFAGTVTSQMVLPVADNTYSLGKSDFRYSQLYAATGTINTSDLRSKKNIENLTDKLLSAWGSVGFKIFQFKDAVEKKGESSARFHIGIIAQDVQNAFASQGLDASRYGFFCHDEWQDEYKDFLVVDQEGFVDEEGNVRQPRVVHTERRKLVSAGDRYGIRYEEALALECAYLRRRLQKIEAALAANGIAI